jgi:hypothetical protein
VPTLLPTLAGRVPQRWRRRVPMRLRNAIVARFGPPAKPFEPDAYPARLNLGCGYDRREGYLNVDLNDFHAPDLVGDVRSLPMLPAGRYQEIVAQDVLEHLERADGPVALAEWARLMAPGGVLRLRVPDLPSMLRWLREQDDSDHHRLVMHHMFGTQAYDGDFHLNGYTELLLCDELFRAGFGDVEMELRDGWLWEVEAIAGGSPLGIVWGPGFHPREPDGQRWAAESAELCICLGGEQPEELAMTLALSRHPDADTTLQITGAGPAQRLELTEQPAELPLRIELRPGATRLTLTTEGRPADDGRTLAFRARAEATIAALA